MLTTLEDVLSFLENEGLNHFFGFRGEARDRREFVIRCLTGLTAGEDPNRVYMAQKELDYVLRFFSSFEMPFPQTTVDVYSVPFSELLPMIQKRAVALSAMANKLIDKPHSVLTVKD